MSRHPMCHRCWRGDTRWLVTRADTCSEWHGDKWTIFVHNCHISPTIARRHMAVLRWNHLFGGDPPNTWSGVPRLSKQKVFYLLFIIANDEDIFVIYVKLQITMFERFFTFWLSVTQNESCFVFLLFRIYGSPYYFFKCNCSISIN